MTNPIAVSQRACPSEVDRIATLLLDTWKRVDPKSDVAMYPVSFVATFADMARAVVADRDAFEAEIRADEREQIQTWLNGCSGSFRSTTVSNAIAALEHKDAIRNQKDHDHE